MDPEESSPKPVPLGRPTESAATSAQLLFDVLQLERCEPEFDADGDLIVRHRGLRCLILFSKRDAEFLRLVVPNLGSAADEDERKLLLRAANYVNSACKCVKIYLDKEETHATIEMFLADRQHLAAVVMRCLDALEYGVRTFWVARDVFRTL